MRTDPGKTMPKLIEVERDFTAVGEKMNALGPLVENSGIGAKGVSWKPEIEIGDLAKPERRREGPGAGRPAIKTDIDAAEVIRPVRHDQRPDRQRVLQGARGKGPAAT